MYGKVNDKSHLCQNWENKVEIKRDDWYMGKNKNGASVLLKLRFKYPETGMKIEICGKSMNLDSYI